MPSRPACAPRFITSCAEAGRIPIRSLRTKKCSSDVKLRSTLPLLCGLTLCSAQPAAKGPAPDPPITGRALAGRASAKELERQIRAASLDPEQCYRVRDLAVAKEDLKLYFTDGYLIFSKPVNGERISAVFTAEVEGGDGEVVLPP